MDRVDLFRIFTRVVETASFTHAADILNMPRSSVSTAVSRLEEHVGARLLHRTTRKVTPTDEGVAFYERCLRVITDVEEAEAMFQRGAHKAMGKLRVDVPSRMGRLIIIPALPDFLAASPEIDITLGMSDRTINLIEDNVDCVLRTGDLQESGLIARRIGLLPLANVASPLYLARFGVPQNLDALAAHWAVNYASPSTGRVEMWEVMDDHKPRQFPMRSKITVNNAEAYIAACLAGLGLIQIPSYDVRPYLETGDLVEVLPNYRAESMPVTLLYPHRRHLPARVRVFAAWLEKLLKQKLASP